MDVLLMFLAAMFLPWLLFVIPMVYGDKISKDMLKDFNSYPMGDRE